MSVLNPYEWSDGLRGVPGGRKFHVPVSSEYNLSKHANRKIRHANKRASLGNINATRRKRGGVKPSGTGKGLDLARRGM